MSFPFRPAFTFRPAGFSSKMNFPSQTRFSFLMLKLLMNVLVSRAPRFHLTLQVTFLLPRAQIKEDSGNENVQ